MELRRGNLVRVDGVVREVFGVTEGLIQYKVNEDVHYTENWELIELTEEILDNICTLTRYGSEYVFEDSTLWFRVEDGSFSDICLDVFKGKTYLTCIEYLNELQDIIEMLTLDKIKLK